jgi:hypothetical protein
MSEPAARSEPDEDLLEFLGGIDEVNEDSKEGDFSDYLASVDDLEKAVEKPRPPANPAPGKEDNRD